MTNGSSNSNHHPLHPRDDRETLSALFDDELSGDAVRFALKRLDHDADWRETCGRWQMIGDAMRGEATLAAPAGFAAGVMRALSAEAQVAMAASSASVPAMDAGSSVRSRRRWIGGAALAASVAMAAVLVVRPFSESSTATPDGQVAAGISTPAGTQATATPSTSIPTQTPTSTVAQQATTAVAVADAPASANRRPSRASRAAARASRGSIAPIQSSANEPATAVATAAPPVTGQPFHPPADDIVTRPWPRAVLSDSTAAGALTVGFGTTSTSPSLYPFEPRLPSDTQSARPTTTEPQR